MSFSAPSSASGNIAPRPVLFFHTANDTITPTEQSLRMFEKAGMPAELMLVTGTSHFPLSEQDAPRTKVRLDAGDVEAGEVLLAFGSNAVAGVDAATIVMNLSARGDLAEAAANLFGYLRALDARGARTIAVMPVPHHGLGEAINDRLRRAAVGR